MNGARSKDTGAQAPAACLQPSVGLYSLCWDVTFRLCHCSSVRSAVCSSHCSVNMAWAGRVKAALLFYQTYRKIWWCPGPTPGFLPAGAPLPGFWNGSPRCEHWHGAKGSPGGNYCSLSSLSESEITLCWVCEGKIVDASWLTEESRSVCSLPEWRRYLFFVMPVFLCLLWTPLDVSWTGAESVAPSLRRSGCPFHGHGWLFSANHEEQRRARTLEWPHTQPAQDCSILWCYVQHLRILQAGLSVQKWLYWISFKLQADSWGGSEFTATRTERIKAPPKRKLWAKEISCWKLTWEHPLEKPFLQKLCKKGMLNRRYQHLSKLRGFSAETTGCRGWINLLSHLLNGCKQ